MAPSLRRSVTIVFIAETLSRALPVLTMGYAARALGTVAFGQAHLLLSAVDIALTIVAFGYGFAYASRRRHELDAAEAPLGSALTMQDILWSRHIIVLRLIQAVSAAGILFFVMTRLGTWAPLARDFALVTPLVVLGAFDATHYFVQTHTVARISSATTIAKVGILALIFLFIRDEGDRLLYVVCMLLSNAVVHVYSFAIWLREAMKVWQQAADASPKGRALLSSTSLKDPSLAQGLWSMFKASRYHALALCLLIVLERIDWLVGNQLLSSQDLGTYVGMTKTLQAGSGLMTAVTAPFLSEFVSARFRSALSDKVHLALILSVGMAALAILVIGCLPDFVFGIVLGPGFTIDPALALLATVGIAGQVVFFVMGFQLLQVRGKRHYLPTIMTAALVVSLLPLVWPEADVRVVTWFSALARLSMGIAACCAARTLLDSKPAIIKRLLVTLAMATAAGLLCLGLRSWSTAPLPHGATLAIFAAVLTAMVLTMRPYLQPILPKNKA